MSFFLRTLLLLTCLCDFFDSYGQHQVIVVLEEMQRSNYQFEVNGSIEVPVHGADLLPAELRAKYDTVRIKRNYIVAKAGDFASYYRIEKNPEKLFQVTDGRIIITVDQESDFLNSSCLKHGGIRIFPHYLLDDYFQREELSENEMRFVGEDNSSYRITTEAGVLTKWGDLDVLDFRFDEVEEFMDPEQFVGHMSAEKDCSDCIANVRKQNAILDALKIK